MRPVLAKLGIGAAVAAIVTGSYSIYGNTRRCDEVCTYSTRAFTPAHTDRWTTMECILHDKNGSCTMSMPVEHSEFIPDKWQVIFTDAYGTQHAGTVSRETYDNPPASIHHSHFRWRECPAR